jgi:hypothetical protein
LLRPIFSKELIKGIFSLFSKEEHILNEEGSAYTRPID